MVAIEDSASMLCARVMRGISSSAKNETPAVGQIGAFFQRRKRLAETNQALASME